MPATKYKIIAVGPQVAPTATAPVYVNIAGVAKKALPGQPYIVANELVCGAIARNLMLPCPPGALMQNGQDTYYFSLDFNIAGQALPPINPATLVAEHPDLAWGIIAFDAFVMNGDRHPGNLSHDATSNKVQMFDHSHAFLTPGGDIDATLNGKKAALAIGGHCLAAEVTSADALQGWLDRIASIPNYFIEGVVGAACGCGIPQDKKQTICDFMKERRDGMADLFKANMNSFPKLPRAQP